MCAMVKKIILLSLVLLSACAPKSQDTATDTPKEELPKQDYEWVFDPEPWVSMNDSVNPNVLSIGDSISGGYMAGLIKNLGSEYDVRHPIDNCRNSFYTLQNIDAWLSQYPNNEIILWNNGVWDSTAAYWYEDNKDFVQAPASWYGVSLEDYESNLIQIARKLKATGARVVFLTTTDLNNSPPFVPGKELLFNEIAKRVLPSEGVEVFDLYPIGKEIPYGHTSPIDVHFTRSASQTLADSITAYLKQ